MIDSNSGQLPTDPVTSTAFYSTLGIDRLTYMLSLRNKEIILSYKDQYPDTIDTFIQEINQSEFWSATKTTYLPKGWIDLYRTLKELPTGTPTVIPRNVIRIIPDFKKKTPTDVLHHLSNNFQQLMDEDVSKIATCLASKMLTFPAVSLVAPFKANNNFIITSQELQTFGVFPDSLNTFIQRLKSEDYWTAVAVDQKGSIPGVASTLIGVELQVKPLGSG
jgi:hypothetical protein